jgi:hypothetical protein
MARAMLIHFALYWPQASSTDLWPFAVNQAIYIWNHLQDSDTKLSPIELFTQTKFHNHHHLQNLHVFGCPVYVLDPTLQDAKKLPKWNRQSRRAVYLGYSRQYSNNVHIWFSTLKQAISLLSTILFSMIPSLLSIQMELSMPTSGTHR